MRNSVCAVIALLLGLVLAAAYEIRKAAVHALGRVGGADKKNQLDMRAAKALTEVFAGGFADRSAEVRQEAVMALGILGIPSQAADKQANLAALRLAFSDK